MGRMARLALAILLLLQACGRVAESTSTTNCERGQAATPPQPRLPGAIDVTVQRLAAGCGTVLVSSAIPLAPRMLTAAQTSQLRLFVGGKEQALYVEALPSTHADGSLRAVLVQFNYPLNSGSPVVGQLVIGQRRETRDITKPTAERGSPAAVVLPTDPAYLISTDIVGPTLPATATAVISPTFQKYEADFQRFADSHWNGTGAAWADNYYDRALIYYAWWVRTGEIEFWKRATAIAMSYRRDFLEANRYATSPHWSQMEGLEKHYLLTGDEKTRYAIAMVGEQFLKLQPELGSTTSWWENRIQARLLQVYFLAWRLQAVGTTPQNWAALLDESLTKVLGTQTADGSYRFDVLCGGSLNYMTGLLNDQLIKHYTYYKADARIPGAVQRAVDFLWTTQWSPTAQAFAYNSVVCAGVGDPTPSPDLNNLMVNGFGWTYQQTGNAVYRDRGDQVFAGGVAGSYLAGTKQFNEEYTASYRYPAMR
jgi:hypothetical protein